MRNARTNVHTDILRSNDRLSGHTTMALTLRLALDKYQASYVVHTVHFACYKCDLGPRCEVDADMICVRAQVWDYFSCCNNFGQIGKYIL